MFTGTYVCVFQRIRHSILPPQLVRLSLMVMSRGRQLMLLIVLCSMIACHPLLGDCCKATLHLHAVQLILHFKLLYQQEVCFDPWSLQNHLTDFDKIWYLKLSVKHDMHDFLVVKVNCWSYVFNIMKYMWILRNVKNKNIVEKNVSKCAPMICLLFTSDDVISGKHNQTAYWVLIVDSRSLNNT